MRKLLGVLLALVVATGVIGFFRGWYTVEKIDEGTITNISLRIDRQRVQEDADAVRQKVGSLTGQKSAEPEEAADESASPEP